MTLLDLFSNVGFPFIVLLLIYVLEEGDHVLSDAAIYPLSESLVKKLKVL